VKISSLPFCWRLSFSYQMEYKCTVDLQDLQNRTRFITSSSEWKVGELLGWEIWASRPLRASHDELWCVSEVTHLNRIDEAMSRREEGNEMKRFSQENAEQSLHHHHMKWCPWGGKKTLVEGRVLWISGLRNARCWKPNYSIRLGYMGELCELLFVDLMQHGVRILMSNVFAVHWIRVRQVAKSSEQRIGV